MKTLIFYSAVLFVLLTLFSACSDNPIGTDLLNERNITDNHLNQNSSYDNLCNDPVLLWSLDELNIRATNENMVKNKITYTNSPFIFNSIN